MTTSTPQAGRPVYQLLVDGRLSHYSYTYKQAKNLAYGLFSLVGDKRCPMKEVPNNTGGTNFIIKKKPRYKHDNENK